MMKKKNIMEAALFLASESGEVDTMEDLCQRDWRVLLEVTFQGDTPLHIAARKGHLHLVTWILDRQPSLAQLQNKDKNRPLHEAAKSGNQYLVEFLLQRTCSCFPYNKFGETALIIGSKYRHVEIVNLLLTDKSTREIEWELSAREAAYRGYTDIVVAMLGNPIKPNLCISVWDIYRSFFLEISIPSIPKTTILHRGVQGGHLETVMAMLDHDWWKNDLMTKEDEHGRCAVHVAAMKGHWTIINEFMNRMPACVEIRSSDHKSVLHFAVEYDQFEVVHNLLLNQDAETVKELVSRDHDSFHNTALHLAAINGVNPQLLECLLSPPGVDVNALNDEGMTALDIASAAAQHNPNCAVIVETLEVAGGIRSSPIPKSNTSSGPSNDSKQGRAKDIINTHMVVASLIATVTFAAIFQIPGGIEDDKESLTYGAARFACDHRFRWFLLSDTAAFTTSLSVVIEWSVDTYFGGKPSMSLLSGMILPFSIIWMIVAFVLATVIVAVPPTWTEIALSEVPLFNKTYCRYKRVVENEIYVAAFPPVFSLIYFYILMFARRKFPMHKDRIDKTAGCFYIWVISVFTVSINYIVDS